MAEVGTDVVFKLDDSGDSLTDVSQFLNESGFTREIDALETTTYGKTKRTYIAGLEDGTISLGGPWDVTIEGHIDGIIRTLVDFEYFPAGEADAGGADSDHPKYSGKCLVTSWDESESVDEVKMFSAELQQSGALTRATS